jgi:hypothetical protein
MANFHPLSIAISCAAALITKAIARQASKNNFLIIIIIDLMLVQW